MRVMVGSQKEICIQALDLGEARAAAESSKDIPVMKAPGKMAEQQAPTTIARGTSTAVSGGGGQRESCTFREKSSQAAYLSKILLGRLGPCEFQCSCH